MDLNVRLTENAHFSADVFNPSLPHKLGVKPTSHACRCMHASR